MTFDIEHFTIEQLEELIDGAKSLLAVRIRERKAQAMVQARAILEQAGVSPRELARTKAEKKQTLALKQGRKYVNPERPDESWIAGKGRRPKWVAELDTRGVMPLEAQ